MADLQLHAGRAGHLRRAVPLDADDDDAAHHSEASFLKNV
jgi:hypothetical protein